MNNGYRHVPDYDRCGWGTSWGCKLEIDLGSEVSIVLDAAEPEDLLDNGHRLCHTGCLPASAVALSKRRRIPRVADITERRASVVGAG